MTKHILAEIVGVGWKKLGFWLHPLSGSKLEFGLKAGQLSLLNRLTASIAAWTAKPLIRIESRSGFGIAPMASIVVWLRSGICYRV